MTRPARKARKRRITATTGARAARPGLRGDKLEAAYREALEQQAATGEILRVISASPADAQPVFDAIARHAQRLFDAPYASVARYIDGMLHLAAYTTTSAAGDESLRKLFPAKVTGQGALGKAVLSGEPAWISDIETDPGYSGAFREGARTRGYRSLLAVPMLREGAAIGAIVVTRAWAGQFTDHQIDLLRTFAGQAVIALENVRLFNETKEALEQQTATAEILRVISSSPSDMQPVFDSILEHAMRLCDAGLGTVGLYDGKSYRHRAQRGGSPEYVKKLFDAPFVPGPQGTLGRMIAERLPVHIPDYRELPAYREREPRAVATVELGGARTYLAVPMLKDGQVLGGITIRRAEVRPFTQQQIDLLSTFANQAVIAIENVRLFNETREALERQTATSEILQVISASPTDVQPVLDAIVQSAVRLFPPCDAVIVMREGNMLDRRARAGPTQIDADVLAKLFPAPYSPGNANSPMSRCIETRSVVEIEDLLTIERNELARKIAVAGKLRSATLIPLLREDEAIGLISIQNSQPGLRLNEKQLALARTFAAQAVIAIENVRLFREIQDKGAQLEIANKHKSEFLANMSHELRTPLNAIIGFSEVLSDRMFGEVNEKQLEYLKDIHESGRHLLSLINDILDLSKIEAGRMDLDLTSFDLPGALSNAMTLIRERAQRHGIALALEVDRELGEMQADERKFKQIMLNLLSNAVKFTPDGGKVDVSAKRLNGKVEVAVRDTGIGIAPEDQAAVFEEFKQVGRDRMRKAEGTGLGLALTRRFVELHGGAIRLESAPGKGSTFTVELPLSAGGRRS